MHSITIYILKTSKLMLSSSNISWGLNLSIKLLTLSFPMLISQRHLKFNMHRTELWTFHLNMIILYFSSPWKLPPAIQYKNKKYEQQFIPFLFPYHLHPRSTNSTPFHITPACPLFAIPNATVSMWSFLCWSSYYSGFLHLGCLPTPHSSSSDLANAQIRLYHSTT